MSDLERFERRVKHWQRKLSFLGIGQWEIEVRETDEPNGNPAALASVDASALYDSAVIEVRPDGLQFRGEELDRVILHELLHIFLGSLQTSIEAAEPYLSGGARNEWSERVHVDFEKVIERLARQIARAYR